MNFGEVGAFVQKVKESAGSLGLEAAQVQDLSADASTVESQLRSSQPKKSVISECLYSIKSILEGAAGTVLAAGLLTHLTPLLS
jgi:hypothetical protein